MLELTFSESILICKKEWVARGRVSMRAVGGMKKLVFFALFVFVSLGLLPALASKIPVQPNLKASPEIMTVDEVRAGMKGVAYTVFQGTKPETMGVEVLGVLKNMLGPKSDLILVRLEGEKAEYTGVVAGMSGSPVYINGKMLGAISYRIGSFSKEPIAGVTPIMQMLEISEFDRSVPGQDPVSTAKPAGVEKTGSPGPRAGDLENYAQFLQPIDAPFVFNGFSETAVKQFSSKLAAAGIVPVMGVGAA